MRDSSPFEEDGPSLIASLWRGIRGQDIEDPAVRDPMKYGHAPHARQLDILRSTSRHRIVVAANRGGKSEVGMRDMLWCCRGEHPYRKVPLLEQAWMATTDYPTFERSHRRMFEAWCPPSWKAGELVDRRIPIRRIDGGVCWLHFLSYDMGAARFASAAPGAIVLDEEPPEAIVRECLARIVTSRGWILVTFTPVLGQGWWYEAVWRPAKEGRSHWQAFEMPLAERDEAAPQGVGRSLVPHLTQAEIADFAREYPDEDERAVRVFGEVRSRSGLVYKAFTRETHVLPEFVAPKHWTLWGGLDPGFHGFAAEVMAQDEVGRLYRVGEYFSSQESTGTRLRALAALCARVRPANPEPRYPLARPPDGALEGVLDEARRLYDDEAPTMDGEAVVFWVDTEDPQVVLELNLESVRVGTPLVFASLDQGLKARKAGVLRLQQLLALEDGRTRGGPTPRPGTPVVLGREPLLYLVAGQDSEWKVGEGRERGDRLAWELERAAWKRPPRNIHHASPPVPDDQDDASAGGAHCLSALRYAVMARMGAPDPVATRRTLEEEGLDPLSFQVWEAYRERLEQVGE